MALVSALSSCAPQKKIDVSNLTNRTYHFRLKNGLQVIVKEDHSSPITAVHMRVKTGSIHETGYFGYGLSHFFEHSLFLGSENHPHKDAYSAKIESYGGANVNAYTTFDHTAYHFTVLSEFTKESLQVLEDFIFHPLFPEKDVKNEMGSILSEMDMRGDDVSSYFSDFLSSFVFKKLPYKYPVIGYSNRFKKLTVSELLAYYQKKYVPGNMILSVAGDFDAVEIMREIKKIYSSVHKSAVMPIKFEEEVSWKESKTGVAVHPKASYARVSWIRQAVSYYDDAMYPLDVLSSILASGRGSLLYDRLKDELGLVEDVEAFCWTPEYSGIFEIGVSLSPGLSGQEIKERVKKIEFEIDQILKKISSGRISKHRIDTVKREVLTSFVNGKETLMSTASSLASSVMVTGGLNYDNLYLKGIRDTSRKDIADAVSTYFNGKPLRRALLLPPSLYKTNFYPDAVTESDFVHDDVPFKNESHARRIEGVKGFANSFEEAVTNASGSRKDGNGKPTEVNRIRLDNGITVLHYNRKKIPKVVVGLMYEGGLPYETGDIPNGAFDLLTAMLMTSNDRYSRKDLIRILRENTITLTPFLSKNAFGLKAQTLSDRFEKTADVLMSVLTSTGFSEKDFQKEKDDAIFEIRQKSENGWYTSSLDFKKIFFKGTPYVNPSDGTVESLNKVSLSDLQTLRRRFMTPDNLILSVYGDVSEECLENQLLKKLRKLRGTKGFERKRVTNFQKLSFDGYHFGEHRGEQTFVRMGYRAPMLTENDTAAVRVLSGYLSGMGGPLFDLRSVDYKGGGGRAYQLGAFYDSSRDYGAFVFYSALRYGAQEEYEWFAESIKKILNDLNRRLLDPEELRRSVRRIEGDGMMDNERLASRMFHETIYEMYTGHYQLYMKSLKATRTVTPEKIRAVVRDYFKEEMFEVHVYKPAAR